MRKITGTIGRSETALSLGFVLLGNLSVLSFCPPAPSPGRKDRLWEGTCLELFLGIDGSEGYWEFNLSPSGDWNVYRFASYRKGMREEPAFPSLPFRLEAEADALRISLDVELGKILPAARTIDAGVAAVIKTASGRMSHWALAHPGPRPDFHRRDGFLLRIPPS